MSSRFTQEVQYAATLYTEMLRSAGALISMAEVGEAWQNEVH